MFLFIWIPRKQFKLLEDKMSKFLEEFREALALVKNGHATDPSVTEAIEKIKDDLTANKATDEEQTTAIMELTKALAESTPVNPDNGATDQPIPSPVNPDNQPQ